MKKYKVLFFSKEPKGGTGTFLQQISLLDHKKFRKVFYFFKKEKYFQYKHPHLFINLQYPKDEKPSLEKIKFFLDNLKKTYNAISYEHPNLVFVCDFYSFILISLLKALFLKNTSLIYFVNINVAELIENKSNLFYRFLLLNLFKIFLNKTDCLIFPSKELANFFVTEFNLNKKNFSLIPYGIGIQNINKFIQKKSDGDLEKITKDKNFKIISLGRLDKQKDFQTIIKAFAEVERKIKNVSLYIVGDGELKSELIKLVHDLKISDKAHFLGWEENVYPYLKSSDLFVFSSYFEGFGMVILEAMACKLPVIATNSLYGPAELLGHDKYGKLTKVGDYQGMAREIEEFIRNPYLRLKFSKLAYRRAKEFDIKKMLKSYENLFTQLIKNE